MGINGATLDVGYHEGHQVAAGITRPQRALPGCPAFPTSQRALQIHGQIFTPWLCPILSSIILPQHFYLKIQGVFQTSMPNNVILNFLQTFSSHSFSHLRSGNSILPATQSKTLLSSLLCSLFHLPCPIHQQILVALLSKCIWEPLTSQQLHRCTLVWVLFSLAWVTVIASWLVPLLLLLPS